jgi:hypothetical protein
MLATARSTDSLSQMNSPGVSKKKGLFLANSIVDNGVYGGTRTDATPAFLAIPIVK